MLTLMLYVVFVAMVVCGFYIFDELVEHRWGEVLMSLTGFGLCLGIALRVRDFVKARAKRG